MLLYEKYSPQSLNGLIGNRLSIEKIRHFGLDVHSKKRPKPLIVYGPSGTGKTTALKCLAYSNGFELVELTSSDYRDADTLKKRLLPAVSSRGLFGKTSLILFDEIDELSSKFDKGAESVILQILREAKQPIAFTATDYWDQRISFLRNHVERIEFKKVETREIVEYMRKITKEENKTVEEGVLKEIAIRSDGDVRCALNDLEMVFLGGNDILDNLGVRNRKLEIFRVLDRIFLTNNFSAARGAVENSDIDMSMLLNWVDENIPTRYWVKHSVARAYSELAFSSRFFEMAERVRYYGYMKYSTIGIGGVSISSGGNMKYLSPYSFPAKIKYLGSTKESRGAQAKIAAKLSPFLHTNRHEIISSYLPLFKKLFQNATQETKDLFSVMFEDSIKLDGDEIDYLMNAS